MDGVVFRDQGKIGVGVVIRNDQGELMGAMSKKIHFPVVAVEAKAKAMEKRIMLAWDQGLKNIIVEGDSLDVVQALKGITPLLPLSRRLLKVLAGV